MRALLDANVLISAAIRPSGPPGRIVASFLSGGFELVLSPAIVEEIETALVLPRIQKYLRQPDEALRWLADIVVIADLVDDTGSVDGVCRDPADDVVLAAAAEGRADVIVTGDKDLIAVGDFGGIRIVSPRQSLDVMER